MKKFKLKKISIPEITISGFLLILIILSKQDFLNINMGVMRTGVSYAFYITTSLILNFFLGLVVNIAGDTLAMAIQGGMGRWHYAYFLVPIFITIITNAFKFLFKVKSYKVILTINALFYVVMASIIFGFLIWKKDFSNRSINLTSEVAKIMIWVMFSIMVLGSLILAFLYWKRQTDELKNYVVISIIVSAIIIIVIWFYGPVAFILWKGGNNWNAFSTLQIPRILKTPLNLPIYVLIVASIFKVYTKISVVSSKRW